MGEVWTHRRADNGAVFVDFGKDFELEGRYFDEPWDPPFYTPSLLQIGALPDIEGQPCKCC